MRKLLLTSTLLASLGASAAMAQEFSITAGATLTTRYMVDGAPYSKGVAFQPWVEVESSGFYAGLWASNIGGAAADGEVDLYFGYRNEIGKFSYDVSYAHYFDFNPSADSGEFILSMAFAPVEAFSIGTKIKYNHVTKLTNTSLNTSWGITDALSADLTLGRVNKGGPRYWVASTSYAFNDSFSATLAYHKNNTVKGKAVFSVDYSFSLR
jgi:uncharacterized protein (TIGR02001 family)